ncbi:MAG: DUF4292 domain-containing protein [Muribaculaceae bacterium]|nr:DUF4292 domain-containing protein [Muribaculaceae bacterium]MBR6639626.1 DUF4292 domain-containing protein [Muribaculaceae bacterium]
MMRYLYIAILCMVLLMIAGCRSAKQSATASPDTDSERSLSEHFDALVSSYADWEDVNVPVRLELEAPKQVSISGRATMVRGKSVLISLRVLGMEVANLYITNDSVYATEKIHKYYIAEDINSLRGKFPVSINDVQDLLLGQVFLLERGRIDKSMKNQVRLSEMGEYWTILPKKFYDDVEYAFGMSQNDELKALSVSRQDITPLVSQYSNHASSPAGTIACMSKINLSTEKMAMKATIKWDAEKAKWNTGKQSVWKMPKGYKRISGESLVKTLSGGL